MSDVLRLHPVGGLGEPGDVGEEHGELLALARELDLLPALENRGVDLGREVLRELARQDLQLAVLLADLLGRLPGAAVGVLELHLALLELGDVGVDRDGAASGDFPLGDQDPAAVGVMLQGREARVAMLRQALLNVGFRVGARLPNQAALHRAPDDRLERLPGRISMSPPASSSR
jgi:hypothetical protein